VLLYKSVDLTTAQDLSELKKTIYIELILPYCQQQTQKKQQRFK